MISLSSILWEKSTEMEELLISMDTQLRLYLWTIHEMNKMRFAVELQKSNRNHIYKKNISHYKKRWRDRYIEPDSNSGLNFEDPLKKMNKLVNDSHTYHHVITFKKVLSHIVEDQILVNKNIENI